MGTGNGEALAEGERARLGSVLLRWIMALVLLALVVGVPAAVGLIVLAHGRSAPVATGFLPYQSVLGMGQIRAALENYQGEAHECDRFSTPAGRTGLDPALIIRERRNADYAWKNLFDLWINTRGRPPDCPGYAEHAPRFGLPP